jgi:hypothetical protein
MQGARESPADSATKSANGASSVVVSAVPADERGKRAVALAIGRALELPAASAAILIGKLPATLPQRFDEETASALVATLHGLGAKSATIQKLGAITACSAHPHLEAEFVCARCDAPLCALCATGEKALCPACERKAHRSRMFFHLRLTFLLGVLVIVVLWALSDVIRRKARNDWNRTLNVAIVILRTAPIDATAVDRLRDRVSALEGRLADEYRRYGGTTTRPFHLELYGPVDVPSGPPGQPQDGVMDLVRYTYDLWRYVRDVNRRAELRAGTVDSSIYLVTRPPRTGRPSMVEGTSEEGGKVGIVEVDLDNEMADFALFVAAHELLHTLGATDKYDATGRAVVPAGLAEPELVPLYPQRYAEVMARNVPLAPSSERPPRTLGELRVGAVTAREIGWVK